jgi:CRP-like cAMP-binding protein
MRHIPDARTGNNLLDALLPDDFSHVLPHLEQIPLPLRLALYQPGELIDFVYFPQHGMVSIVATMDDQASVEVGVTGKEGFVGVPIMLEADTSPHDVFIQVAGSGLRMKAGTMRSEADRSPAFRSLLFRYVQFSLVQVSQTAACNARHPLEVRLARWLLMAHARLGGGTHDTMPLTQEFLAMMLGVQRPGVSIAAGSLQNAGLIRYRRGNVTILDRDALEDASCGCYRIVEDAYKQLFPANDAAAGFGH